MATRAERKKEGGILETIRTVFWALVIAGIFRTLFFQPFWIPSSSMKETLLVGDFLFVNKMAYGYSAHSCPFSVCRFIDGRWLGREPERGDVIVFRHPVNGQDFIKRVIGLPGDRVQMRQGTLYLNGEEAVQTPAGVFVETYERQGPAGGYPRCSNGAVGEGALCEKPRFVEALPAAAGGHEHTILDITERGQTDTTPVFTVPEGTYFFMGDNRDNSTDSRVARPFGVGFVPFENLLGRADRVMFSSAGRSLLFFWTWRPDRFYEKIV